MTAKLLSPTDAAARLGVTPRKLLQMSREGLVERVTLNARTVRFQPAALAAVVAAAKR